MNFYFRKRPIDLLCSNVKGGGFSSGNSILMQRESDKQKESQKQQKAKVRAVGDIGGTEVGVGTGSHSSLGSLSGLSCLVSLV